MLSASAYSFRQKSRLAISLSWVAGYVNVIAFTICGQLISHMTGNTSHLGLSVGEGDWHGIAFFGFLVGSFFTGAVSSAVMTEGARRRGATSKYILPLAIEGILLATLAITIGSLKLDGTHRMADYTRLSYFFCGVSAFAMGLQNATITKISGSVVRTTHLTGVITDLGLEGVQYLHWVYDRTRGRKRSRMGRVMRVSRREPSLLRLALLASILGSFLFGATFGALVFLRFPFEAMLAPVAFLAWIIFIDWHKPIADVEELDLLADPDWTGYAEIKSILPPELGIYRLTHHRRDQKHAMPDLGAWVERLPRHWKVVILAVSPLTAFDPDAALDLSAAVRKLRSQRRDLVICGLFPQQYRVLNKGGVTHLLGVQNVCPDLDFAIARGMNRVEELLGTAAGPA
jgi:uncharacterized membrane protein YoaK (UPF0700 family)